MNKKDLKAQAFPGRKDTMGYVNGLTKLEWVSTMILSNLIVANQEMLDEEYMIAATNAAKKLLAKCEEIQND